MPSSDGQRNCPKHVEFYSKNIFEKLVHLVGFIIKIYHDARSPERQNSLKGLRHKPVCEYSGDCKCYYEIGTECLEIVV